jgi:transcriptional regulator of arginine metabolism
MKKRLPFFANANRLEALRLLLGQGKAATQDELRAALESQAFRVTQSTVSRDLQRLGAVKVMRQTGQTAYHLPTEATQTPTVRPPVAQAPAGNLVDLVLNIQSNGATIVITTVEDAAPLISRHLDSVKPEGVMGTLAGDDTIFVAPMNLREIAATIRAIRAALRTGH